jgi:uncharacterized protein (DUF983 family)
MSNNDTPGMIEGLFGPILEPYYMLFKPGKTCPECGDRWKGYYVQYMNYCHFCGVELIEE